MKKICFGVLLILASSLAHSECTTRRATNNLNDSVSYSSATVCVDGDAKVARIVKVRERVLETEVPKSPNQPNYFWTDGYRCRFFQQAYFWNNKDQVSKGVICQIDRRQNIWEVMDVY